MSNALWSDAVDGSHLVKLSQEKWQESQIFEDGRIKDILRSWKGLKIEKAFGTFMNLPSIHTVKNLGRLQEIHFWMRENFDYVWQKKLCKLVKSW